MESETISLLHSIHVDLYVLIAVVSGILGVMLYNAGRGRRGD